ncbi:MAG: alkaline shock response membrane anchor protein AmaP [Victivallales bacterium]|nr:alkaline shock response membrane anchor protein AmaP [Victivallales bacterium]
MEETSCKVCDYALAALQNSQFWTGALAGFVVALLICLIWKCISFRSAQRKEIVVEDSEKGTFTITNGALMAFVRNIADSFEQVDVVGLRLVERRDGLAMVINVKASADAEIIKYLGQLREKISSEMNAKLGIVEQVKAINFETQELVPVEKEA